MSTIHVNSCDDVRRRTVDTTNYANSIRQSADIRGLRVHRAVTVASRQHGDSLVCRERYRQ